MAYRIKLGHQRRPRGLAVLVDRAERAERRKEEMRQALSEAEREGVGLRGEKDRAAAALMAAGGELDRVEAESDLAFYDAQTATKKAEELDAANVIAMDHVGDLLDTLHADLDSIEADLDEFIKGGK